MAAFIPKFLSVIDPKNIDQSKFTFKALTVSNVK